VGIYFAAAWTINDMLSEQLEAGQQVARLLREHYLVALALTAGSATLAAALAGMRSARIEPSDGLRDI
jgi:putative ABC transport system permease protein